MYECCAEEKRLIGRINKISGQVASVKKLLQDGVATNQKDQDPYEIVRQLTTIKGALNGMIHAYVEHFAKFHLVDDIKKAKDDKQAHKLMGELTNILKTYTK